MRVGVLGASGRIGSRIVSRAIAAGHSARAQSRTPERLASLPSGVERSVFDPQDEAGLSRFAEGLDAVVFALGESQSGPTTLFSDVTAKLLPAMRRNGVRRLIAITGVGAGETRGHGGWFYDYFVFPLFTRHRYSDKERQEALIAASDLDWIIVRPAPFKEKRPSGNLEVVTQILPETRLTGIGHDEVAEFVVSQLNSDRYLRMKPFIGHA